MSTEVIDIICQMDMKRIQSQLVLQCAPLIVGLKISNLFVTEPESLRVLRNILHKSDLSFYVLSSTKNKVTCFIFREKSMDRYLRRKDNQKLLTEMGYNENLSLTQMMLMFRRRYRAYQEGRCGFPHEMGVFLGYPIEDVRGFIENDGRNCLYSGYWKVYEDADTKKETFRMYEIAKETLVCLLAGGMSIREIMETFCRRSKVAA
ncbi:MAG: DUF3793 family protein [Eubacterium sp.]|nr:DUF3793 family protein [Eubacterium sp.]